MSHRFVLSKHSLPTTQEMTLHMDITRWSILQSDWLYYLQPNMEKLYKISKNKTGSWLWLRSWTPYTKFRLKLKKVGKTTRPFKFDLNQIPYDYTVEEANRLKGLDLIGCMKNYGHCIGGSDQDHPPKKKCQKAKLLPEEALQIAVKRRDMKGKGEKERDTHLNAEFQKIARRDNKAFLRDQCKEI